MIDSKVKSSLKAALQVFSKYNGFDAAKLEERFYAVFSSENDFLTKVDDLDAVFDDEPGLEELREIFFDLLMINFFSADVIKLEDDYLESPEWEQIEEDTLDRGTELLNLLLYLNECADENIEPELEDYLKEFLLVDDDEFQDEYRIYEPIIVNQILIESPVEEISKVAKGLDEDTEIAELFYPLMCFFQDLEPSEDRKNKIAENAVNKSVDMAILEILINFN